MQPKTKTLSKQAGNSAAGLTSVSSLKIRVAGRFPMRMEFCGRPYRHGTIAVHQHDYPCSLTIGKRKLAVRPGDVTVTPSRVTSRYDLGTEGFHWCVHFIPQEGQSKFSIPLHVRLGAAAPYVSERMERIAHLQRMADMNRQTRDLFTAAASAALSDLLCWLMIFAKEKKPQRKGRVESAVPQLQRTIEDHLREKLSIMELARETGLSQDYLSQQFRKRFGMTLQRYVLSRRIEMARNLLLSTDLPVKTIGWECGVSDQQYFNKQFRRVCGMSPSQFREAGSDRK